MCEAAICVLNYLNYNETIECVDSILRQKYCIYHIIIVDNGSDNGSYSYLKRIYNKEKKVTVLHANRNYGFAKGHNIGIHYARKHFQAKYILLLNSDTILPREDYLRKMVNADEERIGVLGSKIIMRDGKEQKSLKSYVTFPATLFYYLFSWADYCGYNKMADYFERKMRRYARVELLHGCALMLTPHYFKFYSGLCSKTFLYGEEDLLYIYCKRYGLEEKKVNDTFIIHRGGQSVKLFYGGGALEKEKYRLKSLKFILLESLFNLMEVWK